MTRKSWVAVLVCAGMLGIPATRGGSVRAMEHHVKERQSAGQVITGRYQTTAGSRAWRLFVPSLYDRAKPPMLLVVLHGCTQTAEDVARGSRMDVVAEARGFLVLFPEQPVAANPRTCWNWFDPAHQGRDAGEPLILAGLVADVMRQFPVDPARVHIAGISAGAAMAGLVAVAYPERFATLVSLSGVPWQAAKNVGTALSVMKAGAGASTPTADAMLRMMGPRSRALPVLVVHGGADAVVAYQNAEETSAQWVGVHDHVRATNSQPPLQRAREVLAREHEYTTRRVEWRDADGGALVTRVRIDELGHAWGGGSPLGTFTDAKGPDVSTLVAVFCERHRLP